MVQRKVPSKVLIHADNVEFDKHSSQHQDGITSGDDMNKSRSIQFSDSEAYQSSSSRRSFSKPRKPSSPSHVQITAKSPHRQQPLMRTERSPHYMKPTRSSSAKEDKKPKFSNNWKNIVVPGKKPAKTLTRPSSFKLSSTSTQNPSFKSSRESPRKSCKIAPRADMNAQRTSCSSVRKVCLYTFCSLNDHHLRTPLPPLKSFLSERRSLFKAQKTMKQEEISLQRLNLKVPSKTKVSDIEQIVIDGNSACDDAEEDFFIEIYANVKEHEAKPTATGHGHEMRKLESSEELQDQEFIKFMIEENSLAAREDNIKKITTNMSDESPELESNSKKDFKKYYDDTVTKVDTMPSLYQEQNEESADENHLPSCSHEDTGMEICCRGIRFNAWEQLRSSEMDGCDFGATDTEWKEKRFCTSKLEERVVSAVLKEETEFKLESSSESLLEASVKSDKILSTRRLEEIKFLVEEAPQEGKPQDTVLDLEATIKRTETRSLIEEVFQNLTNAKDNDGKNETSPTIFVKDGTPMSLSDQIFNASEEECKLNQVERETNKEGSKNLEMKKNTEIYQDFAKQVQSNGYGRQGHEVSELQGTRGTVTEEKRRRKNWSGEIKHKIPVKEDDEQRRKFNQRKPNFLPLIPNPEREKVILKHQIMEERKSAEQWMLDNALRQAVTKLAPVRKSKVALLVEAFEEVMPITQKEEKPLKKGSAFGPARNVHV